VQKARSRQQSKACTADGAVQVLVISQHDAVRRQLVAYLGRSPALVVSGDELSAEAITRIRPAVLVLDLSQLGNAGLHGALAAAQSVGARVIALASIREPADERAVVAAGGLYRLKSAGADGLADTVLDVARWPAIAAQLPEPSLAPAPAVLSPG
jgi:DNA-binding NarL/FixJ family response regulator